MKQDSGNRHGTETLDGEQKRNTDSQVNIFLKSSNIVKELRSQKLYNIRKMEGGMV